MTPNESHASIHRKAVKSADRSLLSAELGRIENAKFCVIGRNNKTVYFYGTSGQCVEFASGIERNVEIVNFTAARKENESSHKVRMFRAP